LGFLFAGTFAAGREEAKRKVTTMAKQLIQVLADSKI
jgi:hypothetical protein